MGAYYNEIDPLKAEVLREAIRAGAIAPGDVDERSIADVESGDLVGYTQCHFFAGGGFWSLALRWAGWPDDRPVWTGSCPCPSFSAAGKGAGFNDPRHLWPHWDRLIDKSRPPVLFGEQADDAIGFGWLDLVQTDLEAKAYAVGSMVFGAHSVGAPHIRQRLYFVADTERNRGLNRRWSGKERLASDGRNSQAEWTTIQREAAGLCATGELGVTDGDGCETRRRAIASARHGYPADAAGGECREGSRTNPLNGFWRDADWIGCRDGKFRPVEPGTFPLAHGSAARVGRLRLYGDGIVVTQAQAFIESYLDLEVM